MVGRNAFRTPSYVENRVFCKMVDSLSCCLSAKPVQMFDRFPLWFYGFFCKIEADNSLIISNNNFWFDGDCQICQRFSTLESWKKIFRIQQNLMFHNISVRIKKKTPNKLYYLDCLIRMTSLCNIINPTNIFQTFPVSLL